MGNVVPSERDRRWTRLRIILVALNLRVTIVVAGPLLPVIALDLHLSSAAAGFVLGLPLLVFAIISPFAPTLAARIGTDRVVLLALIVLVIGAAVRSLPLPNTIWVGTALLGASIGILNVLLPSVVSRDLRSETSRMTAVYTATQGVATAVGVGLVMVLSLVLPGGWRTALAIWGVLAIVAAVVWQLSGTRLRSAPQFGPSCVMRSPGRRSPGGLRGSRPIWHSLIAWAVTIFMGLQSLAFYVYMSWVPSYQLQLGVSEVLTGVYTTVFYVVSITSSLCVGGLLGRMRDQRHPAVLSSVMTVVTFVGLILLPDWFLLWSVTGGAACGSLMVIALSLITYRTADFASAAKLSAMAQSIGYGVAAAGPVLFGLLLDRSGSGSAGWVLPLALTAATMLLMAIIGSWVGASRTIR